MRRAISNLVSVHRTIGLAIVLQMAGAHTAAGDILRLTDGRAIEGTLHRVDGGWKVSTANGDVSVTDAEVAGVDLLGQAAMPPKVVLPRPGQTPPAANPSTATVAAAPDAGLASLRRVTAQTDSPAEAVGRYERFVQQVKGTPVEADAVADLAVWIDRRDRGLVRSGGNWVTQEQRSAERGEALGRISPAREFVRSGDFTSAEPIIADALKGDPTHPSAWYLRGLIQIARNELPGARRAFENVTSRVPSHAPSHNNLGVILFRQNQQGAAMNAYLAAMNAAPGEPAVLDNVAEALNALTPEMARGIPARKAAERFAVLDRQLAEQRAAEGWVRWGSGWMSQDEYQQVNEIQKQVTARLDAMAGDFRKAQEEVTRTDIAIQQTQNRINEIENQSVVRDSFGRTIRLTFPSFYYDLQNEKQRLLITRDVAVRQLEEYRRAAEIEQAKVPRPSYRGEQSLIGVEGTPVEL